MTKPEEITDSPTGWVAQHVRQYVDSGGTRGARFQGYESLLITTRGRRSGTLRRTALFYGVDGDRYLLVASNGGSRTHPNWYLNLVEHPEVTIQVGPETFAARARTAGAEERPALWELMARIFPPYNGYQAKAGREIPVVVIERG